jgi:hypothetical protein
MFTPKVLTIIKLLFIFSEAPTDLIILSKLLPYLHKINTTLICEEGSVLNIKMRINNFYA